MGRFERTELEEALRNYNAVVDKCSETGDWSPFADLFTEDVEYIEHAYGIFHGREEVRGWIVDVMAPFPHMRFEHQWTAFDETNDAIVVGISNVLDHPTDPNAHFGFPNVTRIVYAGNGLFSSEEDVYNPVRDAPRVVGEWAKAGGTFRTAPIREMKHIVAPKG
ncbi:nuclear transport factor 2 family protein [Nocardia sp. NPDC056100]|uniref:nuclear transport factor 2 family protein n=1 Tax=Nocardia sp. NPDC056100 TaxID=3345712 RepID=UPI0035DC88E8